MAVLRSIPVAVQRQVLERDGMTCQWCNAEVIRSPSHVPNRLHFDHVIPWAAGGGHTVENLVVSCARCNLGRVKPKVNVRATRLVEYRHGRYWWPGEFAPPKPLPPRRCGFLLAEFASERHVHPMAVVRDICQGRLFSTGVGEPIAVAPIFDTPPPFSHGRRRRHVVP